MVDITMINKMSCKLIRQHTKVDNIIKKTKAKKGQGPAQLYEKEDNR